MEGDPFLLLMGAWIYQVIRVVVWLFSSASVFRRATPHDRLAAVGLAKPNWSSGLAADEINDLLGFRRKFAIEFYILLLVPMWILIAWLLLV